MKDEIRLIIDVEKALAVQKEIIHIKILLRDLRKAYENDFIDVLDYCEIRLVLKKQLRATKKLV